MGLLAFVIFSICCIFGVGAWIPGDYSALIDLAKEPSNGSLRALCRLSCLEGYFDVDYRFRVLLSAQNCGRVSAPHPTTTALFCAG